MPVIFNLVWGPSLCLRQNSSAICWALWLLRPLRTTKPFMPRSTLSTMSSPFEFLDGGSTSLSSEDTLCSYPPVTLALTLSLSAKLLLPFMTLLLWYSDFVSAAGFCLGSYFYFPRVEVTLVMPVYFDCNLLGEAFDAGDLFDWVMKGFE